jgi:hypothetical protein
LKFHNQTDITAPSRMDNMVECDNFVVLSYACTTEGT